MSKHRFFGYTFVSAGAITILGSLMAFWFAMLLGEESPGELVNRITLFSQIKVPEGIPGWVLSLPPIRPGLGASIVLPPKLKVAWFLPGGMLRARRDSIDGVVAWLSWLIVPEPVARRLARRFITPFPFFLSS